MQIGEVYKTKSGQQRFVLGHTPNGDVAFAIKGSRPGQAYSDCHIQPLATFIAESPPPPSFMSNSDEIDRVTKKHANYIASNNIT